MGAEHDQFMASLEDAGLDEIRARLAVDAYGEAGNRRSIAREWVTRKEQAIAAEAQRSRDILQASQAETASRAAEAAERAAEAAERQATTAEKATRIATAALIVAIVASILSLIALVRH
jgi:hypothetical protein